MVGGGGGWGNGVGVEAGAEVGGLGSSSTSMRGSNEAGEVGFESKVSLFQALEMARV